MIVHFFEPPPAQAAGGLNLAIRSLEAFLVQAGISVRRNSSLAELGTGSGQEVVHFHGLWQPRFLSASSHCRRAQIPYIVSPHGMLEPWAWHHKRWKKWVWFRLLERRHLDGAARLLATSDDEAHNLESILPYGKSVALPLGLTAESTPNYVAAREALGWAPSEVVLLYLSRIHPKKGLHLLLAALARLGNDAVQHARLVIVGGGEEAYLRELKRLARRERGTLPRVVWVGEIWGDARWAYFQGADLFCLPSFSENFGLAILEALQVGTRVLTTNQTPWSVLPSLGAGFVVEPAEDAVKNALAAFLAAPEWSVEQRAKLATEIQRRFSWDVVGPSYISLYRDVLGHV